MGRRPGVGRGRAGAARELADPIISRIDRRVLGAFREALPRWFEEARRPLPWRVAEPGARDPYRVWVSEVMLQQTRSEQARPYFERFLDRFPTIGDLAAAPVDDVLKAWEGLGYYARARNLHRAAGVIAESHDGRVPDDLEAFRALPGVGAYTSAAVLSIAYGRPLAALDGNVIRVLARVFAVGADARAPATRAALQLVADRLLAVSHAGLHNEALMELGATVCTPRQPNCPACPLLDVCAAALAGRATEYPVMSQRRPVPCIDVAIGIVEDDLGRILVQRRREDAMLGGLWEFPGGKVEAGETAEAACRRELLEEVGLEVEPGPEVVVVDHVYSHFAVRLHVFRCPVPGGLPRGSQPLQWVTAAEMAGLAMPRANRKILDALAGEPRGD